MTIAKKCWHLQNQVVILRDVLEVRFTNHCTCAAGNPGELGEPSRLWTGFSYLSGVGTLYAKGIFKETWDTCFFNFQLFNFQFSKFQISEFSFFDFQSAIFQFSKFIIVRFSCFQCSKFTSFQFLNFKFQNFEFPICRF